MKSTFSLDELNKMKRQELYDLAQNLNIKGRSKLNKAQLIDALAPFCNSKSETQGDLIENPEPLTKKVKKESLKDEAKEVETSKVKSATKVPAKGESKVKKKIPDNPLADKGSIVCGDEKKVQRLDRSFGKQKQESVSEPRQKGAEVKNASKSDKKEDSIAKIDAPGRGKKTLLEEKNSSLKTTMEIPVFPPQISKATEAVPESELSGEIPEDYGETQIVLQVRDPHWAHAYWQLPQAELKRLEMEVGIFEFAHSNLILRLHNVSDGISHNIRLTEGARNWYIHLERAMTVYQVELGLQSPTEGYTFIALSNLVQTPPDRVAKDWATLPEVPHKHSASYGPQSVSGGKPDLNRPHEVKADVQRIAGHEIPNAGKKIAVIGADELTNPEIVYGTKMPGLPGSLEMAEGPVGVIGLPSSEQGMPGSHNMPSSWSPTSPGAEGLPLQIKEAEKSTGKDFWLVVNTELIVYGATEPDANVTIQGVPIELRPDGTFSVRFHLPDGIQEIPVKAVNKDGDMERVITPVVTRQTY